MSSSRTRQSASEPSTTVELSQAQLRMYVQDVKQLLDAERENTRRLRGLTDQLEGYARDLKAAFEAEQQKSRELGSAYHDFVLRMTRASQYRDEETGAHIKRLSHYVRVMATYLRWDPPDIDLLFSATPMHDLGKIGIPDAVLLKAGPLTASEWEVMKQHTVIGANLLRSSPSPLLESARQIALSHHERWDGSGYPQGLKGEDIPLAARIVMIVDQYDALRSTRPYKPGFSHGRVCEIILKGDGRSMPHHFDPQLLEAFKAVHPELAVICDAVHD